MEFEACVSSSVTGGSTQPHTHRHPRSPGHWYSLEQGLRGARRTPVVFKDISPRRLHSDRPAEEEEETHRPSSSLSGWPSRGQSENQAGWPQPYRGQSSARRCWNYELAFGPRGTDLALTLDTDGSPGGRQIFITTLLLSVASQRSTLSPEPSHPLVPQPGDGLWEGNLPSQYGER